MRKIELDLTEEEAQRLRTILQVNPRNKALVRKLDTEISRWAKAELQDRASIPAA